MPSLVKHRVGLALALVVLTGLSAAAMYVRRGVAAPEVTTEAASRGAILNAVSASGTLEAVETVLVGTQVSGTVQSLYADFNSIVRKGQVLARLDPSLIQAEVNRTRANLVGAEADLGRFRVLAEDAQSKLQRARELAARQLIPAAELDAAEMTVKTAEAQQRSAQAQVAQARAAVSQAQANLQKTVITSPIDGIVISRDVDVGQTVAASLQAPTLYTIAADLARMQLKASIDESDLGNIHEGQRVTFRVDAYPNDVFSGAVEQVRLNPVVEQNVVTYAAIVTAPNADLKLKPGMTASLTVEVARRDNVLRVPSAALRFKPTADVLAALAAARDPVVGEATPAAQVGTSARSQPPASPDQGTVWVYEGETLQAVRVKTGISDGVFTEIVEGPIAEGTKIATRVALAGSVAGPARSNTNNPLMGQMPRR
jgi:HlyD family secretion protein